MYVPESGEGREVAHLGHFPVGGHMECFAQGDEGPERAGALEVAAFMELCPNDIKDQVFLQIDEINENYAVFREKVLAWTTNEVEQEKSSGRAPGTLEQGHDQACTQRIELFFV